MGRREAGNSSALVLGYGRDYCEEPSADSPLLILPIRQLLKAMRR